MPPDPELVPVSAARDLLLCGQGLLNAPGKEASGAAVLGLIERLGFVQLDSINIVERAHHHILWTRLRGYRPEVLGELQGAGSVFEHWTHDASIIPSSLFPHWRHRFRRVESGAWSGWLEQKLGRGRERVLKEVLERVRVEGARMARDFDGDGHVSGPWWDWKPAKAALEYWWRAGRLAIAGRVNFHKVYDLTERVLPRVHGLPEPTHDDHVDWACRSALERLGVATAREIGSFWGAVTAQDAARWCARSAARGEIVLVMIQAADGAARAGFAWPDWRGRARGAAERGAQNPPGTLRLLSPFDPLVRDRARGLRLFGFDYRFEAFVPEKKRKFGYYVLPVLEHSGGGARLVGRVDPKLDRGAGVLRVRGVWWEPGVRETAARRRALRAALDEYAAFNGADSWTMETGGRR